MVVANQEQATHKYPTSLKNDISKISQVNDNTVVIRLNTLLNECTASFSCLPVRIPRAFSRSELENSSFWIDYYLKLESLNAHELFQYDFWINSFETSLGLLWCDELHLSNELIFDVKDGISVPPAGAWEFFSLLTTTSFQQHHVERNYNVCFSGDVHLHFWFVFLNCSYCC